MVGLHRDDRRIDRAALEGMHGRRSAAVNMADLRLVGGEIVHAPILQYRRRRRLGEYVAAGIVGQQRAAHGRKDERALVDAGLPAADAPAWGFDGIRRIDGYAGWNRLTGPGRGAKVEGRLTRELLSRLCACGGIRRVHRVVDLLTYS